METRIAIIIPVFNGMSFLSTALESICDQSGLDGFNLSVIFIDDGSTDGSVDWIRSLSTTHQGIEVISKFNETNRGRAFARNVGLKSAFEAGVDWVTWLDQDDFLPPNSLRLRLQVHEETGADWIQGKQQFILMPGVERPSWCRPEWLEAPLAGHVLGANLIRTHVAQAVGKFNEGLLHNGDDVDWFLRAKRMGCSPASLSDIVLVRQIHGANGSANPEGNVDLLRVLRAHLSASRSEESFEQ